MKAIITAKEFTHGKIGRIREVLREQLPAEQYAVVLGGSYARGEASEQSDLDYYIVSQPSAMAIAQKVLPKIKGILKERLSLKSPSQGGPFAEVLCSDEMRKNIGGADDNNNKITVRILFLTEGE
jgi:predicted nucleotidyltransferase